MKEDTLKRIEQAAKDYEKSEVNAFIQSDPITVKSPYLLRIESFIIGAKSERNTTLDEVIELLKEWGHLYTSFGDDTINTEIFEDLNKMKLWNTKKTL